LAAANGHYDVDNSAIKFALEGKHFKVAELLIQDPRVIKKSSFRFIEKHNLTNIVLKVLNLKSKEELENYFKII
jgi:hypothetical protein